jgi:hypothetical protein
LEPLTVTIARELKDDLLPSIGSIAEHVYGEATPQTERRVRHLIERGELPTKKIGGRYTSRKSWLDQLYAEPDQPAARRGGR